MGDSNLLGEYLRARRARVAPADAGLAPGARRRVPGLRREEVALLAGISADYYLRLEQGRDRHPSHQVLESLAAVLCPDATTRAHLLALGGAGRPTPGGTRPLPASIGQLLEAMTLPAFVQDKHLDTVAANAAARALSPTLVPGTNRLLAMFLDPAERALFLDWDDVVTELVAAFRAAIATDADDPRSTELITELSAGSPRFAELWARHDVESRVDRPPVRFLHPGVGELTLTRDNLAVDGPDGLRLVVYHAPPGSPSGRRLARLLDDPRA